eukprot:2535924-Amphidinium_carterae.1
MACKVFTTPLQSLTTIRGWRSSKAHTTAKSSALKTDRRQPGRASQDLSPVSLTSVSDIANLTSAEVRVAAVSA